jgi:predicted DNA-binding transcriptional regulator AlpA
VPDEPKLEPEPELWDIARVARFLGVAESTVRSYLSRSQMPRPDLTLGGSPVWRADTIRQWYGQRRGRDWRGRQSRPGAPDGSERP